LKILLITSGQPTLNPRLVKEADALTQAGYEVTVLYQYWNEWATIMDRELLETKNWNAIRVGGSPVKQKSTYWLTRFGHKVSNHLAHFFGVAPFADAAIGRCALILSSSAKKQKADLYIAHNLAALPAAVKAARKNNAKVGFDAEDFHRAELVNDPKHFDFRLKKFIEDKYFQQIDYLTTSSPGISALYQTLFKKLDPKTILNVFNRQQEGIMPRPLDNKLKMIWFSQTIGPNRGLEDIIAVLKFSDQFELHLLGNIDEGQRRFFDDLCSRHQVAKGQIFFHRPIPSSQIAGFCSQFNLGLALEPGFSINNESALSNKIFTYLQAGLAVVASDTTAQALFMKEFPGLGEVYQRGNLDMLVKILKDYLARPDLLLQQQQQAYAYAQNELSWDMEKEKFISIVKQTLQENR
jgi:glycosyltransferase involved in cell wall biosynthesis